MSKLPYKVTVAAGEAPEVGLEEEVADRAGLVCRQAHRGPVEAVVIVRAAGPAIPENYRDVAAGERPHPGVGPCAVPKPARKQKKIK